MEVVAVGVVLALAVGGFLWLRSRKANQSGGTGGRGSGGRDTHKH